MSGGGSEIKAKTSHFFMLCENGVGGSGGGGWNEGSVGESLNRVYNSFLLLLLSGFPLFFLLRILLQPNFLSTVPPSLERRRASISFQPNNQTTEIRKIFALAPSSPPSFLYPQPMQPRPLFCTNTYFLNISAGIFTGNVP